VKQIVVEDEILFDSSADEPLIKAFAQPLDVVDDADEFKTFRIGK